MRIREAIDRIDSLQPNQYSEEIKVRWLSVLDKKIHTDILLTHESKEEIEDFVPYSTDNMEKELIVPFPYDELYPSYLQMMIDKENGETARYNNSATIYNALYLDYAKNYNKEHRPVNKNKFRIW